MLLQGTDIHIPLSRVWQITFSRIVKLEPSWLLIIYECHIHSRKFLQNDVSMIYMYSSSHKICTRHCCISFDLSSLLMRFFANSCAMWGWGWAVRFLVVGAISQEERSPQSLGWAVSDLFEILAHSTQYVCGVGHFGWLFLANKILAGSSIDRSIIQSFHWKWDFFSEIWRIWLTSVWN